MNSIIGEIEMVKTSLLTGEVTSSLINNTTTGLMYKKAIIDVDTTIMYAIRVYVTDADFQFSRMNSMTTTIPTYLRSFNIAGNDISGEFWPQLVNDTENNRYVITMKNRFDAPAATRNIKMIYLASNNSEVLAGVNLPTPCTQTPNDLLDVYYRIYVNYGNADTSDPNYNAQMMRLSGIINKFFIYNSSAYPAYVPGTDTSAVSNTGYRIVEAALPSAINLSFIPNSNISGFTTESINKTSTVNRNLNEGTRKVKYTMAPGDAIGQLIKTVGPAMVVDSGSTWGSATRIIGLERVVPEGTSLVQSVYLRTAASKNSNIPYLDASAIGTSTAKPTFDTSAYTGDKNIPEAFRIVITNGGAPGVATFQLETRTTLGFLDNQFNKENIWRLNSTWKVGYSNPERRIYENCMPSGDSGISYANYGHLVGSIDEKHVLSYATNGVSKINVWNQDVKSWGATTSTPYPFESICDISEGPNGLIYVASSTKGLFRIDTNTDVITQLTGITGVDENKCYTVAVKDNGDVWALFNGGLAKYTVSSSSWEVFNTTSTRKLTNTDIVTDWTKCRGIVVRKDGAEDKLCLITADSTIVWYNPDGDSNGVPVANMTFAFRMTNAKTISKNRVVNMPGTDRWATVNTSRISFCNFGDTVVTNSTQTINSGSSGVQTRIALASKIIDGVKRFVCVDGVAGSSNTRTFICNQDGTEYYNSGLSENPLSAGYVTVILNSSLNVLMNTDAYDSTAYSGPALRNAVGGAVSQSWTKWGWDSATSKWVNGGTGSCPVSTGTPITLPNGMTVKWTADNTADAFKVGEFWLGYLYDGLHKDNSTSATFGYIRNGRDSYRTTDISAATISASGSTRTIPLSFDTLASPIDDYVLSWSGNTATTPYSNYTQMTSQPTVQPASEYYPVGNFKISFNGIPGSRIVGDSSSGNARIGVTRDKTAKGWDIGFGFREGKYYVYDALNIVVPLTAYPNKDSEFTIERVSNDIILKVDGTTVHTLTGYGSQRTAIVCGFYNEDVMTLRNVKLTYTESRPIITIGNVTNSTGIYDPNFAMVEAWVSNPTSAKITIGGVPATIITDPNLSPSSGEVLLLQKSGTLVFNTADIGKAVTSSAVVLREL